MKKVLVLVLLMWALPLTLSWAEPAPSPSSTLESLVAEIDSGSSFTGLQVRVFLLQVGQMYEQEITTTAQAAVREAVTPLVTENVKLEARLGTQTAILGITIGALLVSVAMNVVFLLVK